DHSAISLLITWYPCLASAWATRVVPAKPSNTVCTSRPFSKERIYGTSLSFEPAYLMPSVSGASVKMVAFWEAGRLCMDDSAQGPLMIQSWAAWCLGRNKE